MPAIKLPPPPPENWPLQNCTPLKIPPYEYSPLWKLPHVKIIPHNISPEKIAPWENSPPPGKITPNEISSPLINHANERKNKITNFFLKKILIKITNVLFDAQMILQKILGLDTSLQSEKKCKNWTKAKNRQVTFTWQLYKTRKTKTRQSNYKIWLSMHSTLWILKKANSK